MAFNSRNILSADFTIDGKKMPKPDDYEIQPNLASINAKRRADDGIAIVPFKTCACTIIWKYNYISKASYDILYDAYIREVFRKAKKDPDNAMYHTITTLDSNTDEKYTFTIYTQNDFKAPLYHINNGVREYRDVTITFTSIGGDQDILV